MAPDVAKTMTFSARVESVPGTDFSDLCLSNRTETKKPLRVAKQRLGDPVYPHPASVGTS